MDRAQTALAILDVVSNKTLNEIACNLCKRGEVALVRDFYALKGDAPFALRADDKFGWGFTDPFVAAVGKGQIAVIEALLELGLKPKCEPSAAKDGVTYTCSALKDALDAASKAAQNNDAPAAELATDMALVLYRAVRADLPPSFSLYGGYSTDSSTPVGSLLKEYGGGRGVQEKKPDSLLAYSVAMKVPRLTNEILEYVESTKDGRFSMRDAEVFVAVEDIENFARLMRYTGEVSLPLLKRVLNLSPELQSRAIAAIGEHELPEEIAKELPALMKTMAPESLAFVLEKTSQQFNANDLAKVFMSAVEGDNLPMMRSLLVIGERVLDWSVNNPVTTYSGRYNEKTRHYAIHACQSAEAVKLLVEHGADVEQYDSEGKTPLQDLAGANRTKGPEIASALIEAGADLTVRFNGRTLMQLAAPRSEEFKAVLRSGKTINAIEAAIDDVPQETAAPGRTKNGLSPL